MFLHHLDQRSVVMMKELKRLLRVVAREPSKSLKSAQKWPNGDGDFRAVKIVPSITCCAAATRLRGRPYLLREAPRVPLYGCTMPTNCSCKFLKNADRRDSDRRVFRSTETNRLFAGLESRKRGRRRSAEE
jgi:hypothetical protein